MVAFTLENGIAVLTMDNGKANAFGLEQIGATIAALDRAETEAKAVVLTGSPGMFSAGYDLNEIGKGGDAVSALMDGGQRLILKFLEHPQPVVAACSGHAIALGALLLLACDSRIGARGDYKIGLNETQIGLRLPVFALELVRAGINPSMRRNVVLEAMLHNPDGAAEIGFLDDVTSPEAVMERALETAGRLAGFPDQAYARNKAEILADTVHAIRSSSQERS